MTAAEFIQSLPKKATPEVLEGLSTLFHFDLEGEGGGQFSLAIDGGKMDVQTGHHGTPKCTVKTKSEFMMKVIRGEENPMSAVMFGKIKISNLSEMMKYAKIFGLM
jgi:putative sterol carrier protein